jgi:UDP-N-acetylglucosamine:LPS N-acetylglucosamine transferase
MPEAMTSTPRRKRIMAVASGGGHWVQLLRLLPAFEGCDVIFVTINKAYRSQSQGHRFYAVNDATRWNKFALLLMCLRIGWILFKERPDVVVSTGAAPGYFALRLGKFAGVKTVWIDSIANVEQLSLSGAQSGHYADLWLTQWPHLSLPDGPHFRGTVL